MYSWKNTFLNDDATMNNSDNNVNENPSAATV